MQRTAFILCALLCAVAAFAPSAAPGASAPSTAYPRSLVVAPASFPGFAAAHPELQQTTSAAEWTGAILQDTPSNAAEELARLDEEGFAQGVYERFTTRRGVGLSAALVLGSAGDALRELHAKLAEEQAELGSGTSRFAVAHLPNAVGIQQTHASGFRVRGLFPSTVLFTSGRCMLAVGTMLNSSVTHARARAASIAGASAVYRHARSICA